MVTMTTIFLFNNVRYKPYVVAMAHHVITMWFIRCRIQYRPTIAQFINKVAMVTKYFNTLISSPFVVFYNSFISKSRGC